VLTARAARRLAPALALAQVLACGGGDLVLPAEGEPAAVEVVQGDGQSGRVGVALPKPVVGRVTDSQGRPVGDASVAFAFTDDGTGASVAPDTATTDADGNASFQVVTGTRVGPSGAELRVSTANGQRTLTAPVTFTAVSADANQLMLVGGDGQSAPAGAVLTDPLVVQVTDAFGNPIPGVPIQWTVDGGGSVSQETTPTGGDGLASVVRTLGSSAGTQHTSASALGLVGSPVTFTHTASAGSAAVLEGISGDGQSALVGTSLPDPLVVRVRDAGGNPVAGLAVAWVPGTGGGSLAPATSTTGADGLASTAWTLGTVAGTNTATAVVSGVGTVGFTATATPGTPPGLSLETQPPAGALRGVQLSRRPLLQLREPDGSARRQQGVLVSVSVVEGGATLSGTLARNTGSDGRVEFGDLALVGPPGSYTLAFAATGYTGATSSAIALARAGTTTTIQSDDPDPSTAGQPVRVRFQVRSPGGTPDGNVFVSSDDGASCTSTVAAGECTLSPATVGTRTLTASYAGSPEFEASSRSVGHRVDAPPQPVLMLRTQPSGSATIGQAFPRQPVVQLRDEQGRDLRAPGIVVTAQIASGSGTLGGTVTSTTGDDGRAGFTDLSISGATGSHTLQFTAAGYTPVVSEAIDVQAAAPTATTTTITADDPDPSEIGQAVTVRFAVTASGGTPTGTVTVAASSTESCSADVATGACALTLVVPGDRTLTATYAGDGAFAGSSGTASHVVRAAPPPPVVPSATASSIEVKDASIRLNGSTDVVVTVRDANGAKLENVTVTLSASGPGSTIDPASRTTEKNGEAKFTFRSSEAGISTIIAVAGGVTLAQQPSVSVEPASTKTTITSHDPDPSVPDASITVGFTVTSDAGIPSGNVTVTTSGGSGTCTGTVAQGSCSLVPGAEGTVTLTATYAGDGNFAGSSDSDTHTVAAPAPPSLSLRTQPSGAATPGVAFDRQPEVELRTADGGPLEQSGVTVRAELASGDGSLAGSLSGITDATGRVAFADLAINGAPGSYTLRFIADGFTAAISDAVVLSQAATTTEITSADPEPSAVSQPVTVSFRVASDAGTPTGSVTVSDDESQSCTGELADGSGSCSISFTSAGDHALTAFYPGNDAFAADSGAGSHTVSAPAGAP
jgi:hypothetical protein